MEINGKRNTFYRVEIVVALEHARTVSGRLADLHIPVLERHKSEALGLGLLVLHEDGLKRAADRVVDALFMRTGTMSRGSSRTRTSIDSSGR